MAVKNVLSSYQEDTESYKNKLADSITKDFEEHAMSVGDKLKNRFNFGGILDKLSALGDLPFADKLTALANDFLNKSMAHFKKSLSESINASIDSLTHLATGAVQKLIDSVVSQISTPDIVFLSGIIPLYYAQSDLRYNNDYVRTAAIKYDFPITLEWIDNEIHMEYSIINNYSKVSATMSKASSNSCVDVFLYVCKKLQTEVNYIDSNIKSYESQIKDVDLEIEKVNIVIETLDVEYTSSTTSEERRNEINVLKNIEKQKIQQFEDQKEELTDKKTTWDKHKSKYLNFIVSNFKKLLVNSVGNLTEDKCYEIIKTAQIKPCWFGDYDPDFNNRYSITLSDVNKMAPFYEEKGFVNDIQDSLGDTRLVQTSKLPKTITLQNIWLKYIYVMLNSTNLHGTDNQLSSQVLYERLCYQTMDFLTETLDEAAGMMIQNGLGKDAINALLKLDSAIYDYTKFMEPSMIEPKKKEWVNLMSYGQEIPAPLLPSMSDNTTSNDNDIFNNSIDISDKNLTRSSLKTIIKYYLKYIDSNQHYIYLKDLFDKIYNKYNTESGNIKDFYKNFLIYYFGDSILIDVSKSESYFQSLNNDYLFLNYFSVLETLYFQDYKNKFKITDSKDPAIDFFNTTFEENYNKLKNDFNSSAINLMSDTELYNALLYIYQDIGNVALNNVKYTTTLLTFLRKYYTENAYTINFYIEKYLITLSKEEKKEKLINILNEINKNITLDNIFKNIKSTIKNIYNKIYPSYGVIINIDEKKSNIDINDPEIIKEIENNLENGIIFMQWVKDFDNKLWQENTLSEGDDLEDTNYHPADYLEYTVFFKK